MSPETEAAMKYHQHKFRPHGNNSIDHFEIVDGDFYMCGALLPIFICGAVDTVLYIVGSRGVDS